MTITSTASSSLGEFLAEVGPGGSAGSSADSVEERFAAALEQSLEEAGLTQAEVVVETLSNESGSSASAVIHVSLEQSESSAGSEQPETSQPSVAEAAVGAIYAAQSRKGPQISQDMWTEELLTGDLTAATLQNVQDPSALLNARLDAVREPTDTVIKSLATGTTQGVNPSLLATVEQAEAMLARLQSLGIAVTEVEEWIPVSGHYAVEFGAEERRFYNVAGHNVGMLVERYAKYPVEVADEITLAEFNPGAGAEEA